MFGLKEPKTKTVDIHNMKTDEAKYYLERIIANIPPDIEELKVIHGYNSGTALQNMVRKGLKSSKIKQRILSLNPGETTLLLK